MSSDYSYMLKSLERKSYSVALSGGVIALFLICLLLFVTALAIWMFMETGNQKTLPFLVGALVGAFLVFFGALFRFVMKARAYMQARSIELDLKYPGFYESYERWQAKIDAITNSGNNY